VATVLAPSDAIEAVSSVLEPEEHLSLHLDRQLALLSMKQNLATLTFAEMLWLDADLLLGDHGLDLGLFDI
jgi:hypothetical protein